MRVALFSMVAALCLCGAANGQEATKKDEKSPDNSGSTKEIGEVGGKTLEEWIRQIHTKDPSKRQQAMRMVLAFGPEKAQEAVPAIITELKKHKPNDPIDLSVRISGAVALGTILGAVKQPNKEPNTKRITEAVGVLKRLCDDPQVIVRTRAAQALGMLARLGSLAYEAKDQIIHVAKDRDTWEARHAGLKTLTLFTLMEKAPPTPIVLSVFYNALNKDRSMLVRIQALEALAQFPVAAGEMPMRLSKLTGATKDVEPTVQIMAHLAIMTVKQNAGTANLSSIAKFLEDPDANVRLQAAQALGMIGKPALQTAGYLQATLYDREPAVVAGAIIALAQMDAKTALPALHKLYDDKATAALIKHAASQAIDHLESRRRPPVELKSLDKEKTNAEK